MPDQIVLTHTRLQDKTSFRAMLYKAYTFPLNEENRKNYIKIHRALNNIK